MTARPTQPNHIGGAWVEAAEWTPDVNPSDTTDIVGLYASATAAQAAEAVEAAAEAFPAWSRSSPQQRALVLDTAGTEVLARKDELGHLLAREEGKTIPEAVAETVRAGNILKFFAGEALRIPGEFLDSVRPGVEVTVSREPVGVVALITPWNFPIAIPAWKIAPALAFGNTVVFKPAALAPASSWALVEILSRAGLPPGVLNLVGGRGGTVGDALVRHPKVAAISFTGSVETGRSIAAIAAARMAKVQLEMGGKNPLVVLDDADLGVAVNAAVQGAFYSTGQRCTACSRLVVTEGIHDRFVKGMQERMARLVVDDALAEGTEIGPVVDQAQLDKNLGYVRLGVEEGGVLAAGGTTLKRPKKGFYMAPALITGTDNRMRLNREEVFGPVASVIRVRDYDEALQTANDTPFGLTAGICTTSLRAASHFRRNSEAGMVMINLPTAGVDYHVPFGGRKGSSYGPREQGRYAVEFYTTVKTTYIAP